MCNSAVYYYSQAALMRGMVMLLILTMCGLLHTGGYSCNGFVIDTNQDECAVLYIHKGIELDIARRWYKAVDTATYKCELSNH